MTIREARLPDDEPGDVFVEKAKRRHGFIAELFVEASARAQSRGGALIGACEARVRDLNVPIINVLAGNDKAIAMYDRDGFAPINLNLRKYL